ncbi:hypothetical protein [Aliidiomarina maris]|uniref:Uncharacterized protein n=1 Tax=Aliidiomarina maris TaxID=531312 RepID=A0A327WZ36_9GAMM|nr:hypothetical protein [Aliidiomarina maris]RAJ98469.1 hypothetical protein B0I24_105222 [Aliidiomarina maris]RUO24721.1 hypothetical protein CWE07_06655 [Aliidiomarina maris]
MSNYIWILDSSLALPLREESGVSTSYVVPKYFVPERPENLAGATIWIVFNNRKGSYLFGKIHINLVELFEDGINAGDVCLTVDSSRSLIFSQAIVSSSDSFKVDISETLNVGLHTIEESIVSSFIKIVINNVMVKLHRFPEETLKKMGSVPLRGDPLSKARALIAAASSAFCLDELWGSRSNGKMPPFANLAYQWISEYHKSEATKELASALSEIDPTRTLSFNKRSSSKKRSNDISVPRVDTNLALIDPDKIFARRFVAQDSTGSDHVDAVEKTERAEKRHQDMLREIASRFRLLGLKPMQSSSIDLFIPCSERSLVCELKTATIYNLISQSAKGLFQLGCYQEAMQTSGYGNTDQVLIIESTKQTALNAYVTKILTNYEIIVLFYHAEKPWPGKVSNGQATLESLAL